MATMLGRRARMAAGALAVLAMTACSGTAQAPGTPPRSPAAVVVGGSPAEVGPSVAPVVASVAPTEAATPSEIPLTGKPGSCLVLEERYCAEVTFVASGTEVFAVLKAPAGTIVYAPHSGVVAASTVVAFGSVRYPAFVFLFQGSGAPPRLEAVRFVVGAPTFHVATLATVRVKKKGQRLGVLTGQTFAALGDYNFAMLIASSQGMDFATMRAWFPDRALPPTPTP